MDSVDAAEEQKSARRPINGEEIHQSKREETENSGDKQRRGKGWSEIVNTPSENRLQMTEPPPSPKR